MPDVTNITATYQAPVAIDRQYATLYLLLNGPTSINDEIIIKSLKQFLDTDFDTSNPPHIFNVVAPNIPDAALVDGVEVTSGPFTGISLFNGNRLVAIKWVMKYKNGTEVPANILSNFLNVYRSKISQIFSNNLKLDTVAVSFQPYGSPLTGDKGFPITPPIPSTPTVRRRRKPRVINLPTQIITATPSKPEPIIFQEVKKENTFLKWFLVTIGSVYSLKRML